MRSNRVIKAGFGYIIGGVLIKGIAFITTPIFTRLLSTEEFGVLNTYLSYEAIFAMVIGFQFAASLKSAKIEYENVERGIDGYLTHLLMLIGIHSLVLFFLLNIFFNYACDLIGISSRILMNLLIVNSFCNAVVNVYNAYISLYFEYKKYVIIGLLNALCNVFISIILIQTFYTNNRATARILGYVIPYVVITTYIIIQIVKKNSKNNSKYIHFAYKYCSPLLPYACSDVMLGQFSKLYVERKCGTSYMGIYSLSYNVYSIIGIIRIAMDYLVGPLYFEKRKINDFNGIRLLIKHYSRVLGLASVCLMLFSPEIIRVLGSNAYFAARLSAIPLVAASYFIFLISTVSQEEYYQKKTYMIFVVSVVAMAINIIANIIIVPIFGVLGAAFCTMATYFVMLISHFTAIKKWLKSDIFDINKLLIHSFIILAATIISLIIIDMFLVRLGLIILSFILLLLEAINANKDLHVLKA